MKVDTAKIPGYAEMSSEEKINALLSYEFDAELPKTTAGADELARLKAALDKATEEAAASKRALREKQTVEEAKAAQEAEEREQIMKELESLRKDKAISSHKTAYLELGYDAETAEANAKALHSGDYATVFANQKKFIETQKKAASAAAIDAQPSLTSGAPVNSGTPQDSFTAELRKFAGLPK